MIMKTIKALWVAASLCVLSVILYHYDGKYLGDTWMALQMLMLFLSFPAGLVADALIYISSGMGTSYSTLTLAWSIYFILGYLQWFVLLPYLLGKIRRLIAQRRQEADARASKSSG